MSDTFTFQPIGAVMPAVLKNIEDLKSRHAEESRLREAGPAKRCPTGHETNTIEDICRECGQPFSFR